MNYKNILFLSFFAASCLYATDGLDPFSVSKSVKPLGACENLDMSKPLDLSSVINTALCNNPDTRFAWVTAMNKASQVGINKGAYLPSLDASGSATQNRQQASGQTTNYGQQNAALTFSYLLYDFGARSANLENAEKLLTAANETQSYTVQSVFLLATQAYYQFFAAKASLDAYIEAEKLALESYNAALAKYEVGVATPADKLQAKTAYSQAVLSRGKAFGEMQNAKGTLLNTLGLDADANVSLSAPPQNTPKESFLQNVRELITSAKKARPDLLAAQAEIKAAEAGVKSLEASGRPTISLNSTLGYTDTSITSPSKTGTVGVYLTIPLFSGFQTAYKVRAAKEQAKLKEISYQKLEKQIALEVYKAYNNLTTDFETYKTSIDLVGSAEQSMKVASGRYKAGVGNIIDVLTAQNALASANQQKISALYNWHISKAVLAQSLGILDATQIKTDGN